MDLSTHIPRLSDQPGRLAELLGRRSSVVCFGQRALLGLFMEILAPHGGLCGAATGENDGVGLLLRHSPALLFCTEQLEQGTGLGLGRRCRERWPGCRSLLILQTETEAMTQRGLAAGFDAVLTESRLVRGSLLEGLRVVLAGGRYVDHSVELTQAPVAAPMARPEPLAPLSPREQEVLQLVVDGGSNAEIAARLYVSPDTVKSHVAAIRGKLQARDRTQAAVLGLRHGLVGWG
jgi:DNA-binding NarL/FixJ family response regulator